MNIHTDYVQQFIEKFKMEIKPDDPEAREKFIQHVKIFMAEEFDELLKALEEGNVEEVIDALGDISWHCDKGMLMVNVDPEKVRKEIARANLSKEPGVKPGREDAKVDVIKPAGWVPPDHSNNHGDLDVVLG